MLKPIVNILILLLISFEIYSQKIMENVIEIPWNTENGCKMEKFPEGNYGISSFKIISDNELAVLCIRENKVKVYNLNTKELSFQFSYDPMSNCHLLTYCKYSETYYLFDNYKILCFSKNGKFIKNIDISKTVENEGIVKLMTIENNLFAVCGYRVTFTLIKNGEVLTPGAQVASKIDGVYDEKGNIIKIHKLSINDFEISSSEKQDYRYKISLKSDYLDNDLKYIGGDEDLMVLNRYYLLTFNPIRVQGQMVFYSRKNNKIINSIEIPSIYYVGLYNDIEIYNNNIYQMFTTPKHAVLLKYKLEENSNFEFSYPYDYSKELEYDNL